MRRFVLLKIGLALLWALLLPAARAQVTAGSALRFDGTNGYVSVAHTNAFNAFPLTLTAWFRTTNTTLTRGIASKVVDGVGDGWSLIVQGGRLRGFYYRGGFGNVAIDATSAASVADGRWHHVALAVDAAGGRLLLDGVQIASSAWAGTPGGPVTSVPLQIGRYYNYSERFDGDIDEVSIWNQALDNSAVNYIKHRRLAGNTDGLLGLWHLDEGAGTSTSNAVPVSLGGALVSSPAWVPSTAPIALAPVATNALKFDGVNGYVQVPHNTNLNAFPLTVSAWFRTTNTGAVVQGIVSKYPDGLGNGWTLVVQNGRLRGFYYRTFANFAIDAFPVTIVADGGWHHAAMVVDASGGKLFLDGNVVGTGTWPSTPSAPTNSEPVLIGRYYNYVQRFQGALDEIAIWNRALTTNEIQSLKNRPLAGDESNLLAYWRLDESSGTTAADATGHGNVGTLVSSPFWVGSLARLGDGSQHLLANADGADYTRLWAVKTSPTVNSFPVLARATMRRFHDFGAVPPPLNVVATISAELRDNAAQPVALNGPAQTNLTFNLVSENANAPATNSVASLSTTVNVNPVQLASAGSTYGATVALAHSEDGGAVNPDGAVSMPLVRLLDFNGALFFGTTETRFSSLANTPSPGLIGGGAVQSTLMINNNSGYLLAKPAYHFGSGFNFLNVNLFDDGHAIVTSGTLPVTGPVPDREVLNGITFERVGLTISPANGTRSTVVLQYPLGFSVGSITSRVTTATSSFPNTRLDDQLIPQAPVFTVTGPLYGVEETKPFWMQTASLTWTLAAGEITLATPTLHFVRQDEDDLMASYAGVVLRPGDAFRVSNDGYFRSLGAANGPAVVRADANGGALLSLDLQLGANAFRPHLPYTSRMGPGIPITGGQFVITDDLVSTIQSAIQLAGPVPVSYARDCPNVNCAGVETSGPVTLQFTSDAGVLGFTRDGGLLANGTVPPQNLTWGYSGGGLFAQRTSDVEAGAFQMPGTFLRFDQTTLGDSNRPAVLLFTGNGDGADVDYRERPGELGYAEGLANYAGLNFRGPALGRSKLGDFLTDWYPLIPEAKYYARYGGVSGIHQALTFPANLVLYGYKFTFARYALSYLDSENWQSRTDGAVRLPGPTDIPVGPAGFLQEFAELKLLCRGGLGAARVPGNSGEKYLSYWNTFFTPLSMEFRGAVGDTCGTGNRTLVLGVETKLPFIPEKLHTSLGFRANGNLATVADAVAGTDSRFPIPAELSLRGPAGGKYRITTGSEGYFNNWETPGRPEVGFYNIVGKLDLPFFQDSKVHLHVVPITREKADVFVMGGWRSADKADDGLGWNAPDGKNFFNSTKFDATHRGFPAGVNAGGYRDSQTPAFHPRAEREWLELVKFDYPLLWNKTTHRFSSLQDETTILPVINVSSRLKDLTPGIVDIDFSQDIRLGLPRIKLLDFANDALGELNKPFLSVSNAVRDAFQDLADASGLNQGFRSMQRVLRDAPEAMFKPILEPALDPAVEALYPALTDLLAQNSANPVNFLRQVSNTVFATRGPLNTAVQSINGATGQANSVLGDLNSVLTDLDNTIGLFIRIVGKDPGTGKRRAVSIIVQKIVKDQAPDLGFAIDAATGLADDVVNGLLGTLEPTLAEVERELVEARAELNRLRSQLAAANGEFKQAITSVTTATALSQYIGLAGTGMSNLMFTANTAQGDFFSANPAEAKRQIKQQLVRAFLNSPLTGKYQETFKQYLYDDNALVNQITETLFQQINVAVRNGLQDQLSAATDGIFGGTKGPALMTGSLLTAKVRGAPEFNGDAMRKIRLDADVKMNLPDEMTFGAFLQILELDSSNTPIGCMPPGGPSAEVTLGATKVPLGWAGIGDALTVDVAARWNLNKGVVYGVGGSIQLNGAFDLKGVRIDYVGAAVAIGEFESYFAARAKGSLNAAGYSFGAEVGLFAGKTCHIDPLKMVDPDVEKVLERANEFTGIYVQFGGVFPLTQLLGIPATCLLRADASINSAFYYQGGPRFGTFGGRQTMGLDIELICLLSGQLRFTAFIRVNAAELLIGAEAELCVELGSCPFCLDVCMGVSIKGIVNDGGIDYFLDF